MKLAVIPGDGIGPEVITSARAVLEVGAWASALKPSKNWFSRVFSVPLGAPRLDSTTPSASRSSR